MPIRLRAHILSAPKLLDGALATSSLAASGPAKLRRDIPLNAQLRAHDLLGSQTQVAVRPI